SRVVVEWDRRPLRELVEVTVRPAGVGPSGGLHHGDSGDRSPLEVRRGRANDPLGRLTAHKRAARESKRDERQSARERTDRDLHLYLLDWRTDSDAVGWNVSRRRRRHPPPKAS